VFYALQNTNALFSDTKFDSSIQVAASDVLKLRRQNGSPFLAYGFRNANGKAIVAYWLAAHSVPGGAFAPITVNLSLKNSGIRSPVLIDVVSGEISTLNWAAGTNDALEALPVRDSIFAIADASYFDWPVLPEAPSGLAAQATGNGVALHWQLHGGDPSRIAVERRNGNTGRWERIATQPRRTDFTDAGAPRGAVVCYRVRALNEAGESAFSNIVRVKP
jgi:hypothetical protein